MTSRARDRRDAARAAADVAAGGACARPAASPRGHDVVLRARAAEHAQHVAVEFVHPVIVGKRALPAVAVAGPTPSPTPRASVRPGDSCSRSPQRPTPDGAGPAARPGLGRHDAVDRRRAAARRGRGRPRALARRRRPAGPADGRFVLLYHLLWELTHVCFEHPGLLTEADRSARRLRHLLDEGRLAEVVAVLAAARDRAHRPRRRGDRRRTLVGEVDPGDLVLVHAGAAIARVGARATA